LNVKGFLAIGKKEESQYGATSIRESFGVFKSEDFLPEHSPAIELRKWKVCQMITFRRFRDATFIADIGLP